MEIRLSPSPTIGFDLDLTLVDMRAATARALVRMNSLLRENVDVAEVLADLGSPFRQQLARSIREDRLDEAVATFGRAFLDSVDLVEPLDGAADLLALIRKSAGRVVLITGRATHVARACLSRCGLDVDDIVGGVIGPLKTPAIRGRGAEVYVGDHPLDMTAALNAGIPGIGKLSNGRSPAELFAAGASMVVDSLSELEHLLADTAGRR